MGTEVLIKFVAALLAGVLLWFSGRILAFVQAWIGRGYNVTGTWSAKYAKAGKEVEERAHLHQVLSYVWGKIENHQVNRTYALRGRLSAQVLVATYDLMKKKGKQIDCGAFTLVLDSEGGMEGNYSWMDSDTRKPESGRYVWKRAT